ncbi:hypothetical protein RUM44_004098 [Polyplax serrata]|uniref:Uncharacterized protein n=1 Tax=Polyplax serrata TaxID=468196 RepID=A0ABR1B1V0_POLSC
MPGESEGVQDAIIQDYLNDTGRLYCNRIPRVGHWTVSAIEDLTSPGDGSHPLGLMCASQNLPLLSLEIEFSGGDVHLSRTREFVAIAT